MTKITELAAATLPLSSTDLVEVVQQVGTTPVNKKVAVSEIGGSGGTLDVISPAQAGSPVLADEFDDATFDPAWVLAQPNVNATWREGADVLSVSCPGSVVGSAGAPAAILRPVHAGAMTGPFTVDAAVRRMTQYETNYIMWGLLLTESATFNTGKALWFMPYQATSTAGAIISVRHATTNWDTTVSTTDYGNPNWSGDWSTWMYQRIIYKGSNQWQFYTSPDGITWQDLWGGAKTLTGFSPTHYGFGVGTYSTTCRGMCSAEYFRVYGSDLGDAPAQSYDTL